MARYGNITEPHNFAVEVRTSPLGSRHFFTSTPNPSLKLSMS
jgi:hypothetical protein